MKQPKSIQISVPTPCHEDWNKMTPQEQGRFCSSCQKCVVDFTEFTDEQLYQFFKNYNGGVCGHFSALQLTREIYAPYTLKKRTYKWLSSIGISIFLANFWPTNSVAQGTQGGIYGTVFSEDNQNIPNVLVQLIVGGVIIDSVRSSSEGEYKFKVKPGRYNIFFSHPGHTKKIATEVLVSHDHNVEVRARLRSCTESCDVVDSTKYEAPLIMGGVGGGPAVITSEEIEKTSTRNTGQKGDGFFTRLWDKLFK